jgi:geranylgeranyl reductase family protein
MKIYDCIVLGGGPVGGYTAQKIAESGFSVGIIEEHNEIGLPINCAGLVTSRVLDFVKLSKDKYVILPIQGAHIHSPSNKILTIGGSKDYAYVINRQIFDKVIVDGAQASGAELHLGKKIVTVIKNGQNIECKYFKNKIEKKIQGRLIIGADGSNSIVRRSFNFSSPSEYIRSIGAKISNISIDPGFVEIFINRYYAPGFFAWVIPTNEAGTTARIGLGVAQKYSSILKKCFKNFLSDPFFDGAQINSFIGGTIPLGPLNRTSASHVMLVGDAAAQVKPTSGGGLFPGLYCSQYCAQVALSALQTNIFESDFLMKYHQLWFESIGKELNKGMLYKRIFFRLSNKKLDKVLNLIDNSKILDIINTHGDIDYPSRLSIPLMQSFPALVRAIPSLLF